jgi:hypothetical protein
MLDLASKAAINFLEWHVSIQARNIAFVFKPFLIGHTQYVEVKEEDQLMKNSQFELHNKTYHNLLTGLIILDTGKSH